MTFSTIREIVVYAAEQFGDGDAIRYKIGKNEIEAKSYAQLKKDSESFSCVLEVLGEKGNHVALTGLTSYQWITAYLGIVNSGSVAVPLDAFDPKIIFYDEPSSGLDPITTVKIDELMKETQKKQKATA